MVDASEKKKEEIEDGVGRCVMWGRTREELHEGLPRDRQGTRYNSGVLLGHAITGEEIPSSMALSRIPVLHFGNSSDLVR